MLHFEERTGLSVTTDWIWIDNAFIESVQLCQRTVRRCVHKLASVRLVSVTSVKGRFVKVSIIKCESES